MRSCATWLRRFTSAWEARDELEQLLRLNPTHAAALYLLGVVEADELGDDSSARAHFQSYLQAAPHGKHAAEIRNRLNGLDARRAVAANTAMQVQGDNRLPRYVVYVPSPGVLTEPATPPVAAQPADSEGGSW
jgi:hypothetical protein